MDEYTLYNYVRDAYRRTNASFHRPLTEDLIVHLVGYFGLDILKRTRLIEATGYPGHYVLCGYMES